MSFGAVQTASMTLARAIEVNGKIARAYLLHNGLDYGPWPDLTDVTAREAVEAVRFMQAHGGVPNDNGGKTIHSTVADLSMVPVWLGIALVRHAKESATAPEAAHG